jgi:lincosamide nucleotidyltransferase A/C/D/E
MTAADAIDLYTELHALGISVWIDGGWGVAALLGAQPAHIKTGTLPSREKTYRAALKARGYREVIRHSPWNFELSDDCGRQVDVNSFVLGPGGNVQKGVMYPTESLTGTGTISGQAVRCVSPEWRVKFHSG